MLISFPLLDITSAVTPVAFKSNSPGSTAVSVIPFDWSREVGFFFYARRQLLAPLGHGTLNKNQGICIIHYSRCGAERRHRCPGHCGRTSMSKKPKVKRKKKKITYNLFLNLFLFLCNQQLTSLFRACTISCSTGLFFSKLFFIASVFSVCSACCFQVCLWWRWQSAVLYILSVRSVIMGLILLEFHAIYIKWSLVFNHGLLWDCVLYKATDAAGERQAAGSSFSSHVKRTPAGPVKESNS